MISRLHKCGVLAILLIACAADNSSGAEEGQAQASWENYEMVVERNIFSRDRSRASKSPFAAVKEPAPRPERYIVLRGIVQQGKEHIAFLEDTRTGTTTKARLGDSVAQGQVGNITLDCVEYESNGQTAKIEVGQNLEGGVSPPPIPHEVFDTVGASEVPAAGTPEGGATVSGDEAAILERLREKRRKEVGK